jgi:hypothetical protein
VIRRKVCHSPAPRSGCLLERAIEAGHARAHDDRDEREAERDVADHDWAEIERPR